MVGETIYAKLVIPNKEVRYIFSQKVQNWFRDSLKEFSIRSNREGGKGRSDLLLKPVRRSREAFVIEFKVTKDIDEMDAKADEAIQQIEDKKYDMDLKNDGYKYVSYYGIAFCGKECVVHCKACGITERKR